MMNIADCREHANHCREMARNAKPQLRADLLATANLWDQLADDQDSYLRKEEIRAYIKIWGRECIDPR